MPDYTTPSGAGQLMIRDQGSTVEFWVYTPYRLNWNNLRFNVDANGTTTYFSINYNGSGLWIKVGQINVSNSQTITYRLLDRTNTTSIGGPTSMSVNLERGRVPDPPQAPRIAEVGQGYIVTQFIDGWDGGVPLDIRQIGWGTNPSQAQNYTWVDHYHTFSGLQKGTTYYFWGQQHNAKGWGNWGARSQATTPREPDQTTPDRFEEVSQVAFRYLFHGNGDGGMPMLEWQVGYGTDPSTPTTLISSGGNSFISGLQPATTYFVWSRGRNAIGWGPWSTRSQVRTIAGALIKVGFVHREAIPYIKDNGVWKLARPWGKQAGVWKESQ